MDCRLLAKIEPARCPFLSLPNICNMFIRSVIQRRRSEAFSSSIRRQTTAQAVTPKDNFKVFSAGIQLQLQSIDIAHAPSTMGNYTLPASKLWALKAPFSSISTLFDRLKCRLSSPLVSIWRADWRRVQTRNMQALCRTLFCFKY